MDETTAGPPFSKEEIADVVASLEAMRDELTNLSLLLKDYIFTLGSDINQISSAQVDEIIQKLKSQK